jgi:hypothetical protein
VGRGRGHTFTTVTGIYATSSVLFSTISYSCLNEGHVCLICLRPNADYLLTPKIHSYTLVQTLSVIITHPADMLSSERYTLEYWYAKDEITHRHTSITGLVVSKTKHCSTPSKHYDTIIVNTALTL